MFWGFITIHPQIKTTILGRPCQMSVQLATFNAYTKYILKYFSNGYCLIFKLLPHSVLSKV